MDLIEEAEEGYRRYVIITAILNHRGYHCQDPDCVLECVQEVERRQ